MPFEARVGVAVLYVDLLGKLSVAVRVWKVIVLTFVCLQRRPYRSDLSSLRCGEGRVEKSSLSSEARHAVRSDARRPVCTPSVRRWGDCS